ncbi:hypothetical protein Goshw_011908, partial [Gossypium schwendimanii]|nr:hypothetical protein [Gossypium schwendimanii]
VVALAVVSIGAAVATVTDLQFNLLDYSKCNKQDPLVQSAAAEELDCLGVNVEDDANLFDLPAYYDSHLRSSGGLLLQLELYQHVHNFNLWCFRLLASVVSSFGSRFKTCVLLLGNYYIFGSNPGTTSICGAFVAIA